MAKQYAPKKHTRTHTHAYAHTRAQTLLVDWREQERTLLKHGKEEMC